MSLFFFNTKNKNKNNAEVKWEGKLEKQGI
jgi:hypothetical protein